MQNFQNKKSAIRRFCVSDVLHTSYLYAINRLYAKRGGGRGVLQKGTTLDRVKRGSKGGAKISHFLVGRI